MSDPRSTFDRVLNLSAFDGDSRAALRAMHAHFAQDLPDCTLALLLVRGQVAGRCRLAGLIGPDGTEHVPNLDPAGERVTLPLFEYIKASQSVQYKDVFPVLMYLNKELQLQQIDLAIAKDSEEK